MPREGRSGWFRADIASVDAIVASGTGAQEYITDFVPGFRFVVDKVVAIVEVVGATGGATRLFRLLKGTATIAASKTIVLADVGTKGIQIPLTLSATPENLEFGDLDTLSIDSPAADSSSYGALTMHFLVQGRQRPQQL
jgi:hypothetical protein